MHRAKLEEFGGKGLEAKAAFYEYVKQERRTVAELLWDFWSARPPLPVLLALIPALRPRRYSIASARLAKIHKLGVRYEILMVLIQI